MTKNNGNYGRKSGGQFAKGNPGKPIGARHKATRAIEALLEGEAEALARKVVDIALAGDTTALKLCMDRLAPVPKGRVIRFDMPPIETTGDILKGLQALMQAVSDGGLTTDEALSVASLLEMKRRAIETIELESRIINLEEKSL